ncbi:MAG: sulfate adenylyltransferase subunit 2 [Planctomycetes bacterium]|nr:sulfate adenylyltransferase subunit 2 [Planctomycetota bacterium]
MDRLDDLEARSIFIIREAYAQFRRIAVLWSIGKDSTTLVWLCRKAFFGDVPFPAVHIDTSYKFPEMYAFRDRYAKEWGLSLIVGRNEEALAAGMSCTAGSKLDCCNALKTEALKQTIARHGFEALLLGIRRDEHGIRAKERYFSPRDERFQWNYRDQPAELWDQYRSRAAAGTHVRVHPLLHWSEIDIWEYVRREGIPITDLYFARDGKRYRSIGCVPCCAPIPSTASTLDEIIEELRVSRTSERAGRAQDKESAYTMQKLRALGYM